MTSAFITAAHDYSYLPYQVQAIHRHLPEVSRIVVAQGPFFHSPHDSKVRLSIKGALSLGVEILELTDCHPGGVHFRQTDLVNAILAASDGLRLVLQADCLPALPMKLEAILGDKTVACRSDDGRRVDLTWILASGPAVLDQKRGIDRPFTAYPARVFDEALHIEWCEPGFLHLDKIAGRVQVAEKLKFLHSQVSETTPAETFLVRGVGDFLHERILKLTGEGPTAQCNCQNRIDTMNRNGVSWCYDNIETIVDWMLEAAAAHPWWRLATIIWGSRILVRELLVVAALKDAETDLAR